MGAEGDTIKEVQHYWADPERNIRRKFGEQEIILSAIPECSKAEWLTLPAGLGKWMDDRGNERTFADSTSPETAVGSNGRCNTIWYKAVFKGGVYETSETAASSGGRCNII